MLTLTTSTCMFMTTTPPPHPYKSLVQQVFVNLHYLYLCQMKAHKKAHNICM
jgi:hypothetical protein